MSFIFMTDGIPIVYYGQEQGMHGSADPYNREALWPSGYQNTTAVQLISKLNKLRHWVIKTDSNYLTQRTSILSTTATDIIIQKGPVISVMTNIGSPVRDRQSFRNVADFYISLATKCQRARLYTLRAQRTNY
jgi:alpha-amylase